MYSEFSPTVTKIAMGGHNLEQIPNIKFLRKINSVSVGPYKWTDGRTDGRTHMPRLAVAFPNDARKIICRFNTLAERYTFTTSFTEQ
jgi:hypothetical protein